MDPSVACVSNNDRPRCVTKVEKDANLRTYGYPANTDKSTGEFDLWFPHWIGGTDGPKNERQGRTPAVAKGIRENVKKTMTLDQAKTDYLTEWTRLLPQK